MRQRVVRTSLAEARGLGSAKSGAAHWWAQRVTAAALVPLTLWFLASFVRLLRSGHAAFAEWLHTPLNSILMSMLVVVMFYHATLGLQTIAEDYLHDDHVLVPVLACLPVINLLLAIAGLFAIVRTALL